MNQNDPKKWKITNSTYLVNDRWIKLRADACVTLSGREISPFYVIEYGEWVNCLVLSNDGEVTMLRHYRHGIDDFVLEIIGGGVDEGEEPEAAIRRELEEEIGLRGATIHLTGVSYANPSNQTNKIHSFIALGGTFDGKKEDEVGADFEIMKMPLYELTELIEDPNSVMQSSHLAAILFAFNFLKKQQD
jgi:8-oxo-dGTP pyrophosphatase MutT (NUDIX family)